MKYIKIVVATLVLAFANLTFANDFNNADYAFAFSSSNTTDLNLMTDTQMSETQGEHFLHAAKFLKNYRFKVHYDKKPHRFSKKWGPYKATDLTFKLLFGAVVLTNQILT